MRRATDAIYRPAIIEEHANRLYNTHINTHLVCNVYIIVGEFIINDNILYCIMSKQFFIYILFKSYKKLF